MDNEEFQGEVPVLRDATCHTPGCENEGLTIRMPLVSTVICGGCGNFIDSVEDVNG